MWLIYGSEIAACIGENKYKKKWEAFLSVFKRLDGGSYYREIVARLAKIGLDIGECTDLVIKKEDMEGCVQEFLSTVITTSEDLQKKIETFESDIDKKEREIKEKTRALKNEKSKVVSQLKETEEKLRECKENQGKLQTELSIYDSLGNLSESGIPGRVASLQAQLHQANDYIAQHTQAFSTLQEQVNTTTVDLSAQEERWCHFKSAKKNIISQKQTEYGRTKEEELISSHVLGVVSGNNSSFYKKLLGNTPVQWGVGGRIDGFRDGVLVEIKNRKSKLYDPLPGYDVIQVQSYMQMLDVRSALVIQCLTDHENRHQIMEKEMVRDDTQWETHIVPELTVFIHALYKFVGDETLQCTFFQTPDTKKSYFITALFNRVKKSLVNNPPSGSRKRKSTTAAEKETGEKKEEEKDEKKEEKEEKKEEEKGEKKLTSTLPKVCFFESPQELPSEIVDWGRSLDSYIPSDWHLVVQEEVKKNYFIELEKYLEQEYKTFPIYPQRCQIFNALTQCPFSKIKVVILGLDPYINPGEAHGMSFSVPRGIKFPFSLRNIFVEVGADTNCKPPVCGDLTKWANQGVLLLNSILTVRAGKTGSHGDSGWKTFTDFLISEVSSRQPHVVFLLWGAVAQEKGKLIDLTKHTILKTTHPSPHSYHRGFKGCQHFLKTNQDLVKHGLTPIDWSLDQF